MNILDLIETLWNVKQPSKIPKDSISSDLIETLWNVKAYNLCLPSPLLLDLIETLWNVKYELWEQAAQLTAI